MAMTIDDAPVPVTLPKREWDAILEILDDVGTGSSRAAREALRVALRQTALRQVGILDQLRAEDEATRDG